MRLLCYCLLLLLFFFSTPVMASDVGTVKNVKGKGWIIRGEQKIKAVPGTRIFVGDSIKTGFGSSMGIILRDDTIISMGPSSEMILDEFIFQPQESRFGMVTRFLKGTFSFLSGVMTKLAPESVKIETPVGMVAVRGTHFLVKVSE